MLRRIILEWPRPSLVYAITYLRTCASNRNHSKNVSVELYYRHPTSRRDVNGTDDDDVTALDATRPDLPSDIDTRRVYFTDLESKDR